MFPFLGFETFVLSFFDLLVAVVTQGLSPFLNPLLFKLLFVQLKLLLRDKLVSPDLCLVQFIVNIKL